MNDITTNASVKESVWIGRHVESVVCIGTREMGISCLDE